MKEKPKAVSAKIISEAIRAYFQDYFWFTQLRVGCGRGPDGERTMDMWGITCERPFKHVTVEIKRSRSDYRVDVTSPLKQRRARLLANEFYYAAPQGLLTPKDLPPWAGLIEIRPHYCPTYEGHMEATLTTAAPWYDSSPPTWSFVANLIRTEMR